MSQETSQALNGAILITGASTGIGYACALRLASLGFHVFAGVRKQADAEKLQQQMPHHLTPISLDITDERAIAEAVDAVGSAVGDVGLAGLVNNAGIGVGGPLEFLPVRELRRQLEVNVIGQIAVTQAFLPLIRQGHGRIVIIGSIAGLIAGPFRGPYHASKFAMEAIADTLRLELHPFAIPVSLVEPGSIATPIWEKALATADELRGNLPPQAEQLYGPAMDRARENVAKEARSGIPADRVADVVVHALTAQRPKARYLVGRDAKILALIALLPDRIKDRLILRA